MERNKSQIPSIILTKPYYKMIGQSDEGIVYKLNNDYAFKLFKIKDTSVKEHKFHKIKYMLENSDPNFALPIGIVKNKKQEEKGYFMRLGHTSFKYYNFQQLKKIKDKSLALNIIIEADEAMARIHEKGFIIGDVKGANILITENNHPLFIDTDNYMYDGMNFDTTPYITYILNRIYKRQFSYLDSDKFLLANFALLYLSAKDHINSKNVQDFYQTMINLLNVDKEIKDGLNEIFSDSKFKPYIGPILKRIKNKDNLLSKEALKKLKKY